MNKTKNSFFRIIVFIFIACFAVACATVAVPEMSEAEKAVVLIDGFGDKQNPEIKRLTEKCRPVGPLEYIAGQFAARKKAVEIKADTVHFYYYDDEKDASIVRFWRCN